MRSKSSLRILYVLPFAPRADATHGGSRVAAQIISRMAARHHVAVMYLRASGEPSIQNELESCCELVQHIDVPERALDGIRIPFSRARVALLLATGLPLWAIDLHVPEFAQRLAQTARSWRPDVVQFEFHVMGQYVPALKGLDIAPVLTEYDPGIPAAIEVRRQTNGRGRWMARVDSVAWRRFEPKVIRGVRAVVVFSDRDLQAILQVLPDAHVVVIPIGTAIPDSACDPLGKFPPTVLFVGNFAHPPNVYAAMHLVERIFPLVQAQCPQVRLDIVGDSAPAALRALATEQVRVLGHVADVAPYLDHAGVVVAPLHFGGGMRVKVLEAMAAGKAVVATPRAVQGLRFGDDPPVMVEESDTAFSAAINHLMAEPERRRMMGTRARKWAESNLGWDTPIETYESLYDVLLSRRVFDPMP